MAKKKSAKKAQPAIETHFLVELAAFQLFQGIDDYLALRTQTNDPRIGSVDRSNFFEFFPISLLREAEKFGIQRQTLMDIADKEDGASADRLAVELLKALNHANKIHKSSETASVRRGLSISPRIANHLALVLLNAAIDDPEITQFTSWQLVMRTTLLAKPSVFERKLAKHENAAQALQVAQELARKGQKPTLRAVAKELEVAPSTVTRWFPKATFATAVHKHLAQKTPQKK